MSLVNDMLQDLEAGKREPVPEGVFLESPLAREGRWPLAALVSLAFLVIFLPAAFYLGIQWQDSDSVGSSVANAEMASTEPGNGPQPIHENTSHVVADAMSAHGGTRGAANARPAGDHDGVAGAEQAQRTATQTTATQVSATALPDDSAKVVDSGSPAGDHIRRLLEAAQSALLDDRLTSPLDDNAFSRYQAILLLEPEQAEALQGIQRIAARYLEFYTMEWRKGKREAADQYLDKARLVVNRYPPAARWLDQALARAVDQFPVAETSIESDAAVASDKRATESASRAWAVDWSNASDSTAQPAVQRSVGKSELDKRTALQAKAMIQQGRNAQAETLLLSHLEDSPEALLSRQTLFEMYLAKNNLQSAQTQLDQLHELPTHRRAQLQARYKVQSGEPAEAITLLEQSPPAVRDAPDYHTYLAALYHQAARFADAAELYQRLLAVDNNQATYWLGLAVSLDAMNDRAGALRAFNHARSYSKPDAASRAYIEERIKTLSG